MSLISNTRSWIDYRIIKLFSEDDEDDEVNEVMFEIDDMGHGTVDYLVRISYH